MNQPRKKSLPSFRALRRIARTADPLPSNPLEDQFFERHNVRTDLALEATQVVSRASDPPEIPGVRVNSEQFSSGTITRLVIENEIGSQAMGKSPGTYVTIQVPDLQVRRRELEGEVSQILAEELEGFFTQLGVTSDQPALVVGLGNWNATPDNVGPLTISKLLVTRHLHEYQVLNEDFLGRMRPVAALSPGVLGLTGVETAEIVRGVADRVKPAVVICVDALASMSVERVGTTVQIADVGINPGSGVGNKRTGLTQETLGVPVLALGVPTVIYATTIVSEAVDRLLEGATAAQPAPVGPNGGAGVPPGDTAGLDPSRIMLRGSFQPQGGPFGTARGINTSPLADPARRKELMREVLGESMGRLVVTPKEVDVMVESLSDIIADGLNEAMHPGLSADEAAQLR